MTQKELLTSWGRLDIITKWMANCTDPESNLGGENWWSDSAEGFLYWSKVEDAIEHNDKTLLPKTINRWR